MTLKIIPIRFQSDIINWKKVAKYFDHFILDFFQKISHYWKKEKEKRTGIVLTYSEKKWFFVIKKNRYLKLEAEGPF